MKKLIAFITSLSIMAVLVAPASFAASSDGKIDLYEVFSNKQDQMKTEVGSRVYKWSMHLPDDAVVYKSEQVNYFSMSTTSYQASVNLQVDKNINNLSLEEMLYNMQNQSRMGYYWIWGDKEFQVDIKSDDSGRYIRVIKTSGYYDYYLMDDAAEEFRDYIENRIYIENNNIYNLNITMNGSFYKEHSDMFDKLVSSFRLSFDEKNPYIKELSDSVSTTRVFKNTSYGWKITMNPYWKAEGSPNARNQSFRPVYTDEELNSEAKPEDAANMNEFKVQEGITVNLTGSANPGETPSTWAAKEIQKLKDNYSDKVFEIVESESKRVVNADCYHLVVSYKTVTKKPYIIDNLYVIGNGYKYLVSAILMQDQYQDPKKRSGYETMMNSFTLDSSCLSKYLGRISEAASIMDLNAPKDLKMKKYDFETKVTKGWNTGNYYMYGDYYMKGMNYAYAYGMAGAGSVSNNESLYAFQPESNISLNMTAGLNTSEMKDIITMRVERYQKDDEIRMGLAKISIRSAESGGAQVYYIEKTYDIDAMNKFANEDKTKEYNFDALVNEYEYIVKIGKDTYVQSFMMPVSNSTYSNTVKMLNMWANTLIAKTNYSKADLKWAEHKLSEYDLGKQGM